MKTATYFVLTAIGGTVVLGSYAYGVTTHAEQGELLWGTIPEAIRGVYTLCMLPAALGYLVPLAYFLASPWEELRLGGRPIFQRLLSTNIIFLGSSALWMPMTWAALDTGNQALFWPIQGVLAVTGASALVFTLLLARLEDPPRPWFHRTALWASVFLVWQCGVLDALVWPRFFVIG